MGEMSEDIVEGRCCGHCGIYFENEHGFPVLCGTCWDDVGGKGSDGAGVVIDGFQRAYEAEV